MPLSPQAWKLHQLSPVSRRRGLCWRSVKLRLKHQFDSFWKSNSFIAPLTHPLLTDIISSFPASCQRGSSAKVDDPSANWKEFHNDTKGLVGEAVVSRYKREREWRDDLTLFFFVCPSFWSLLFHPNMRLPLISSSMLHAWKICLCSPILSLRFSSDFLFSLVRLPTFHDLLPFFSSF